MPDNATFSSPPSAAIRGLSLALIVGGAALWLASFLLTLAAFSGLADDATQQFAGIVGIPWPAFGLVIFTLLIGAGTVMLTAGGTPPAREPRRVGLGATLLLAGFIGLWAAWALTADKIVTLISPEADLDCNFSLLVQCGANLDSWQGSVFGFPNPLLGLVGWAAVLVVGVALIAGIRLPRWLWWMFTAGVTGAMALVVWLIVQSIFVLGTLCPWCMLTWVVTIPVFWIVWLFVLKTGPESRVSRFASAVFGWIPLITLACYLLVALVAQLRLDVISYL